MQISNRIEKGIVACLFLIAVFAPHSIAVTQTAWLVGMALWVLRFSFYPRPQLFRSPIDYVLIGFFVLSGISGVFSYNPYMSIGKMRAASLFTIAYLVSQNVPSLRIVRWLAFALIGSCMVNVVWTAGQLALGRGVKVQGVSAESPLAKAIFHTRTVTKATPITDGDIVWQVDGQRVNDPGELAAALVSGSGAIAKVSIYRVEWMPELEVQRTLLTGTTAVEQLGIAGWSRGRDWRATGFYGHWTTYAEVLQLIASLALGILLALSQKKSRTGLLLLTAVAGLSFALAMTVTRGSWIGFAVSVAAMLLLTASRRTALIVAGCAVPLVLAGFLLLQQRRNVGFFDSADQSTSWRQMVWREGFDLLVSKPRHLLVGVGIDSIKGHWREWGLFDNGRQPIGHMHSNLLQIALERGVPALILWLLLFVIYIRLLWRLIRQNTNVPRGLALGALGGTLGFFTSGLV
ncbi:MAG TPA: O-antigen ligase family protein, partial [Pyrinomonadaceae bacterium]|nr:O-antigen ligase family protein [Pyrinomonadaceae bacterium]